MFLQALEFRGFLCLFFLEFSTFFPLGPASYLELVPISTLVLGVLSSPFLGFSYRRVVVLVLGSRDTQNGSASPVVSPQAHALKDD